MLDMADNAAEQFAVRLEHVTPGSPALAVRVEPPPAFRILDSFHSDHSTT